MEVRLSEWDAGAVPKLIIRQNNSNPDMVWVIIRDEGQKEMGSIAVNASELIRAVRAIIPDA